MSATGWLKFFEVAKPFITALYFAGMAGMIVSNPNPWTVGSLIFFAVLMIEVHFMGIKEHLKEMRKPND